MYRSLSPCPRNGCYSYENQDQAVAHSALLRLGKVSSSSSRQSPFLGDLDFDLSLEPVRSLIHSQLVQINLKYLQETPRGATAKNETPSCTGLDSGGNCVIKFGIYQDQATSTEGDAAIFNRPARIKSTRSQRFPKPYCIPGRLYQDEVTGKSDGSEEEEADIL